MELTAAATHTATTASPPVTAVEPEWAERLRADPALFQIAAAVGGPFHVIHPATFAANLAAFIAVFDDEGVCGTVCFGKKANKAGAWLRYCTQQHAGVDAASVAELAHALGNGVHGEDIGITGAAKSDALLWLAIRHGCVIAVDAADELERVADIARLSETPAQILLRAQPPQNPDSRFGLGAEDRAVAVGRCAELGEAIMLRGFSFHLDGYQVSPRAELAAAMVEEVAAARARGHPADRISIGGGIAVDYTDAADWSRIQAMDPTWFHAGRVPDHLYPYHQRPAGPAMLAAILRHDIGGTTLAARLRDSGIALLCEPGRALLDGAGFTAFPVQGYKTIGDHGMTTVAGLSMSVSEQWKGSEYLPDPLLVRHDPAADASSVRTAVGGASCMEYDVLTWRTVTLPARPCPGDLLVYPNTAGYQMDKNESTFHQLPLPPKIVVDEHFRWRPDTHLPTGPIW